MHKVKVAINRSWKDKAIHFDDNIPDEHPDWERTRLEIFRKTGSM